MAILKWPIPMANSPEFWPIPLSLMYMMYSEMADSPKMADSEELARGICHFKIATFSRLSGIFVLFAKILMFEFKVKLNCSDPLLILLKEGQKKSFKCPEGLAE